MVQLRVAQKSDASDILRIYAPYIVSTAFTFETEVPSTEAFEQRIIKCLSGYPWIVVMIDDVLAGYAYASSHRERKAYQWTCECSIYLDDRFKGYGIGKELYSLLFNILAFQGFKNVYAGITLPNEASVRLHEKCGFSLFATYDNVGYKLGAWQKVGWWRLQINNYDLNPAPPLPFPELKSEWLAGLFQNTAERIALKWKG